MKSVRSSLLYSTLMLTGVGIAAQLLGFVYRVSMSRLIGAETLGLYQLIMPAYAVIQSICISGLAVTLSVLSSEFLTRGNTRAIRRLVRTGLRGMLLLWLPLAAVTLLFSRGIAQHILGDSRTQLGLILLLPVLLLTGIENLQKNLFYGVGRVWLPAAVELGEQILRTAAILGLLLLFLPQPQEVSVGIIVIGMLASEVFSSVTLTLCRLRLEPTRPLGTDIAPAALRRKMARIALPVSLTALLGNLMAAANSVLIPRRLVAAGMSETAAMEQFGVMMGMTLPLLMVSSAFINGLTLALVPRLTEYRAACQMGQCRDKLQKALLAVSVCVLPLMALLVILGPDLGILLFGDPRVGQHMTALAVGVVFSCYHAVLACALNALELQNQSAAISLMCGLVQLLFTWFGTGIPGVGLSAFVAGLVCSEGLGLLLALCLTIRATRLKLRLYTCFSAPALAALLMGLWTNLFYRRALLAQRAHALPLAAGAGLALYLLALWAQGVRPLRLFLPRLAAPRRRRAQACNPSRNLIPSRKRRSSSVP